MASGRLDYDRAEGMRGAVDLLPPIFAAPTDRMLLQVYDGGAMPDAPGKVYLGRPAVVTYEPTEDAGFGVLADATRSIPFIAIGREPSVGDVLTAHRIGGVWVADNPAAAAPWFSCSLLTPDLTLHATLWWCNTPTPAGKNDPSTWYVQTTTFTYVGGFNLWQAPSHVLPGYYVNLRCSSPGGVPTLTITSPVLTCGGCSLGTKIYSAADGLVVTTSPLTFDWIYTRSGPDCDLRRFHITT